MESPSQARSSAAQRARRPPSVEYPQIGRRRSGAAPDVFGVAARDVVHFAALSELVLDIGTRGFEQAIATGQRLQVGLQKRFGDEIFEDFSDLVRRDSRIGSDCAGVVQREGSSECRQTAQNGPFELREGLVAPIESAPSV